jgi:response regulator RpfG family c-di-GMP phosphodiesterase
MDNNIMNYKILIVDDEPANLRLLERLFRREYQVITASSGSEALELLELHDVALIISDQRMPGMTGIEFLKRAADLRPPTVRIILTGYTDVNSLVEAINSGVVYKYVTKPWVNEDLQQTVVRGLQHYEATKGQHELKQNNKRLSMQLKATQKGFINLIVKTLNSIDEYAYGHARRTSDYATAIGRSFNFEDKEIEQLSLAAYLHELAQLSIPDHILSKADDLTEEEHAIVEHSFESVAELLSDIPEINEVALTVRYQHEHYDGSGFPKHIQGEQIPLHSRILCVANSYDSMRNPRFSQTSLTPEEAIEQLRKGAGNKFDPNVVKAFCETQATEQIPLAIIEGAADADKVSPNIQTTSFNN